MSHVRADHNLLFGILALQMDFVSRGALIAAMNAWVLDKGKPLGQLLREMGHLDEEEHALLQALVHKHLQKHHDDPEQSLAALSSIGPLRNELRQIADPDLQASLAHVSVAHADGNSDSTGPYVVPGTLSPHLRFLVLRPHARGGLGEVFVARDQELKREVALKEIQERHADQPESRARFLLEAEVTGSLEHPGIVPVYGLGTYADGRPFYAMRFIRGNSLKEAIRAFHEADQRRRTPSERSLALRQLLGRFVDVCDAIAYAHSRGVLHRDLKPGNVMLGKYGETLVVDWGLAKVLGKSEVEVTEGLVIGSSESTLTQAGKALGTPAYMSPEQAAGKLDQLGPRSDVYSLGATLYCLLTGRAPFAEGNAGEVLNRVQQGDFPPPRQVNRQVPAPLEAVCLKAMALKPEDRYGTPRELAEEIEHWLADEPVRAYREPLTIRAGRWVRRHQKMLVASVGALLLMSTIALGISTLLVGQALRTEEQARKERALAQVDALLNADPQAVPALLAGLETTREDVLPGLRELWAEEDQPKTRTRRGRVALALLPVEPALVKDWLYRWMLQVDDPREFLLLRDELRIYQVELREDLWKRADDPTTRLEQRFRALVALAAFDADSDHWKQKGEVVLEHLLTTDPLYLRTWAEALRPVRASVLQPLADVFHGRKFAEHRQVAATLVAVYAADQPKTLVEFALDAEARAYAVLLPRLKAHSESVRPRLQAELAKTPSEKTTEKDNLALRQANAAVTLLHLGEPAAFWPLLRHNPDPSRRTYLRMYLTHYPGPYGIDAAVLLERLEVEPDVSARRALLLSLGKYDPKTVPQDKRQNLVARLVKDYRENPEPGIHGAIEWLLRQWKEDGNLPRLQNHQPQKPPQGPTWYVNRQGQTLVVTPGPVEFLMGSPASDRDPTPTDLQHRRRIPRSFAIATKEVTVEQFLRFRPDYPFVKVKGYSPGPDGPIIGATWYEAAAYCNWLSQQEGLPEAEWCYLPNKDGKFEEGMQLAPDSLKRKGYRLPTEAEWEYACRAGTVTSRFYGDSDVFLGNYAWYEKNAEERAHLVGLLQPNDLGLFDMLGNVAEWCQDRALYYPKEGKGGPVEDREDKATLIEEKSARVLRGGSFASRAQNVRSAERLTALPSYRLATVGLRVARTCD